MIGIQVSRHLKSMQLGASPDTPVPKFRMAILIEGFNFTRRGKSGHKTMPANLAAWPPAWQEQKETAPHCLDPDRSSSLALAKESQRVKEGGR